MKHLLAFGIIMAALLAAHPAFAMDYGALLKAVFGTNEIKDFGAPIIVLIVLAFVFAFWIALRIGKRRQRRMIEGYDAKLAAFSTQLRRGRK